MRKFYYFLLFLRTGKKTLFFLLTMLLSINASAYDAIVNGI